MCRLRVDGEPPNLVFTVMPSLLVVPLHHVMPLPFLRDREGIAVCGELTTEAHAMDDKGDKQVPTVGANCRGFVTADVLSVRT